jgi:predicted RNA polymerase sigma factor
VTATDTHRAIEAVWRIESARLIARLARLVRDVGLAEELAQDALVAALEQWPAAGVPDKPGAWLMATAKHRAIDLLRRNKRLERKHEEIVRDLQARRDRSTPDPDRPWTTTSATTSSASSSRPATPRCPPKPASR